MLDINRNTAIYLFEEPLYDVIDYPCIKKEFNLAEDTLVLYKQEEKNLPPKDFQFLTKILQSVHKPITANQIINTNHSTLKKFAHLQHHATYVLTFGLSCQDLSLNLRLPYYHVLKLLETNLLLADDLNTIAQSQAKKRMLWRCLKQMFKLS